ncbi:hypothetical protein PR202_ga28052 [Eleusine coracana subsp. coracana]|uniref:Uncharacterized protein n=1 Tax=Eleusine coracana subsp. coracana TaxID=191504 RepID=A0AAV5DI32_ELECO|nr:hypothetical protein PR202_ga28052 [Eleusine coracana subsp. coracana]
MFKRSVAFQECDDFEVAERVVPFAHEYKFADLLFWYPGQGKAAYRIDDRVPVNMSGDGVNDFVGFRAIPTPAIQARRLTEDGFEMAKNAVGQCLAAKGMTLADAASNYGMMNADLPVPVLLALPIPGKPVVRYQQHRIQSSGRCLAGPDHALPTACPWDPCVVHGTQFFQSGIRVPLSRATDFIRDVHSKTGI